MNEDWHDVALEQRAWRCVVREGAEEQNERNEHEEAQRKIKEDKDVRIDWSRPMLLCHIPILGVWPCQPLPPETSAVSICPV